MAAFALVSPPTWPYWAAAGRAVVAVAPRILGGLGIAGGAAVVSNQINQAEDEAQSRADAGATSEGCADCPCHRTVVISQSAHPESAQHIADAQATGQPHTLTIERSGATARRRASTGGFPRVPGMQPDEYPPAMFLEGGAGASVRNITASDNMGAGASMGNQLRGVPDGCRVTIVVGP